MTESADDDQFELRTSMSPELPCYWRVFQPSTGRVLEQSESFASKTQALADMKIRGQSRWCGVVLDLTEEEL